MKKNNYIKNSKKIRNISLFLITIQSIGYISKIIKMESPIIEENFAMTIGANIMGIVGLYGFIKNDSSPKSDLFYIIISFFIVVILIEFFSFIK